MSILLLMALAVLSVADTSGTAWMLARTVGFLVVALLAQANRDRLLPALAAGFGSIALAGFAGLDFAIAALCFVLGRVHLRPLAWLIAGLGLLGAASFLSARWAPGNFAVLFPFHNRNHYAVFCELGLPVMVYAWRRERQLVLLLAGVAMFVAALAAGSRTGALLLLCEAVAIWTALDGMKRLWLAAPAAAIVASLFLMENGSERILHPLQGDHRSEIWRSSLEMITAKPWTGWGANQFPRIYPAYAHFDNGEVVNAAHSDWLEWCVEFGLLAGLAWLALFSRWLVKAVHFYPSWGILIGALHAAVDFPFHHPGFLVFGAALAGSIEAYGTSIQTKSTNRQRRDRRIHSPGGARDLPCRAGDVAEREVGVVGHESFSGLQELHRRGQEQWSEDDPLLRPGTG